MQAYAILFAILVFILHIQYLMSHIIHFHDISVLINERHTPLHVSSHSRMNQFAGRRINSNPISRNESANEETAFICINHILSSALVIRLRESAYTECKAIIVFTRCKVFKKNNIFYKNKRPCGRLLKCSISNLILGRSNQVKTRCKPGKKCAIQKCSISHLNSNGKKRQI